MNTVRELVKDRKLFAVDVDRTVVEAARYMMEHNIGAVPVLRNGDLAGILSERDIMNRVVAVGRTPGTTAVTEVMTANPRAVNADETIDECLFIMREFGFRHLPIVEGKQVREWSRCATFSCIRPTNSSARHEKQPLNNPDLRPRHKSTEGPKSEVGRRITLSSSKLFPQASGAA